MKISVGHDNAVLAAGEQPDARGDGGRDNDARADDIRFVLDESGHVVYASPAFCAATGQEAARICGLPVTALVEFAEPDEALSGRALFGARAVSYIDAINEGCHQVLLFGPDGASLVTLRFDRVAAGDGRRYMVGAAVAADEASPGAGAWPEAFSAQLQRLIAPEAVAEDFVAGPGGSRAQNDAAAPDEAGNAKISAQSAEGELRHFLNMSHDLMAIAAVDGVFSRVNNMFNDVLGYSDRELRAMGFMDIVHPADRQNLRRLFSLLRDESSGGKVIDFETRVVGRQGRVLWTEWRQKYSDGMVYLVGRDVTAIKENEAILRRQKEQLDEAQAIGHMGHWRWVVGEESVEWSDEIYRIFGVAPQSFAPTVDSMNAMLHKRDLGRLLQAFQRAIIEQNNYDMEFRITRPDGEMRHIRCEGKCEKDASGDVIALFGIMHDVTERMVHESALCEAKDAAERAYAAKSQFLANMSHELRTPLNAIIGFSEMMQRQLLGPIGTEKYLDYIAGIRESGEHLLDLISDILDMSKIEAGKYELDLEEMNVAKVIKLAVHMMEGRAQDARIRIAVEAENPDLQIIADRRAFMQILLNLLSNAVKFTDPGGHVRVECAERDDYILIRVQDTGIGIPANKIKCITRPFEQAANHYTREHEGTGLGLAITKDLTELHGGTLHIESTVGVGTTVTVRLPYDTHAHLKARKAGEAAA